MEYVKIQASDEPDITACVKKEFLNVCPDPEKLRLYDLFQNHSMYKYFHNPEGPAYIDTKHNLTLYFIDGNLINDPEKIRQIEYTKSFKKGFAEELDKE